MHYTVTIGDREIDVTLQETEDGYVARIGERELSVELERYGRSLLRSFLVDGRSWPVFVERLAAKRGARYVLGIRGAREEVHVADEQEKAAAAFDALAAHGADAQETIESVIPGIVTKILVEPGESVEPGQPLLIIEAMKMENEISGETEGKIQEIHVEAGQTVNTGDPLVTIGGED